MSLRALIIDDELNSRRCLLRLLAEYCPLVTVVGEADSSVQARNQVLKYAPDLVFLDIQMPEEDGLQFLRSIHQRFRSFEVIVVTGFSNYVAPAIHEHVAACLLKPLDPDELRAAVHKVERRLYPLHYSVPSAQASAVPAVRAHVHQRPPTNPDAPPSAEQQIPLPLLGKKGTTRFVDAACILYCQSEGNYSRFFMCSGQSVLVNKSMGNFEDTLQDHGFLRIHHSFIVNTRHICQYRSCDAAGSGGTVTMSNGIQVPVSRRKREKVIGYMHSLDYPQKKS